MENKKQVTEECPVCGAMHQTDKVYTIKLDCETANILYEALVMWLTNDVRNPSGVSIEMFEHAVKIKRDLYRMKNGE